MSKQISIVVLLLLITVFAASCGKDLSRSKAEEMIRANIGPLVVSYQSLFGKPDIFPLDGVGQPKIQRLLNEGCLTQWQKPASGVTSMGLPTFDIGPNRAYQFTAKSVPYVTLSNAQFDNSKTAQTKVADVDKVVIDGITKPAEMNGHTMCRAEYTVHYKPNPLGEILLNKQQLVQKNAALFILYDDGWKLAN